ncbi:VOC family protein [Roseobacter sp. YSTF-M11]|uniref:VOC family protein n=1 Tax=Roseobacter insulae TaxID=2859783 RepID=A0A9X1FUC5_9RHOB|nr:VOC family protein [Roseobacter insulae]MBW4707812.1 VOC family protein [Roseobacter insulae]
MKLAALSLIVPDYDIGITFFCDTLGFDLIEDIPQGHKRWVTVSAPGSPVRIVLARAENDRQRAAIGDQGAGRVWLFLDTDDFARDHARLLAKGIVFEEEPRTETYGTVAVFRDPFGNRWDLIQKAARPGRRAQPARANG